jgi:L-threonylcarbamoyladenylate synthase
VHDDVKRAVAVLQRGGLVGLPTETVYGLGADASNELAVRRIFAVKGRPSNHPLIVHVAHVDEAKTRAASWPEAAEVLARAFWPGPLTLIVRRAPTVSDAVTGGQDTVGLRVPDHPLALELLRAFGGGVAAPSANRYGKVSPTTAQHVIDELGNEVDVVLDGGPCRVGVESTIVDVSGPSPRLLRPGGVPREAIERALGRTVALVTEAADVRAPGLVASHYAPRAGLWVVDAEALPAEAARRLAQGVQVAALVPAGVPTPPGVVRFEVAGDDAAYARALYATLRAVDERSLDVVLAVPPSATGVGLAVLDRLRRAAAPRPATR